MDTKQKLEQQYNYGSAMAIATLAKALLTVPEARVWAFSYFPQFRQVMMDLLPADGKDMDDWDANVQFCKLYENWHKHQDWSPEQILHHWSYMLAGQDWGKGAKMLEFKRLMLEAKVDWPVVKGMWDVKLRLMAIKDALEQAAKTWNNRYIKAKNDPTEALALADDLSGILSNACSGLEVSSQSSKLQNLVRLI